jgi:hypothetical protein
MATQFIQKSTDFKSFLSTRMLAKLNGIDDAELINAESSAISMITDATAEKYDIAGELAKTGTARNATLIRWLAVLCSYFLYGDVADTEIPARVIKNYDDVLSELKLVNQGKISVQLDRITGTDGTTATKFQYGSDARRSHNPY